MTKSIIEEIYFNNLSLSKHVVSSEEYKRSSDKALNFYEQLNVVLNDEQKNIFENYVDSKMGVCAEGELLHFKEGLKVGLLLAME